jgi:hypothetical protein
MRCGIGLPVTTEKKISVGHGGHIISQILMTHNQIQQKCFMFLWNHYPQSRFGCWHTPNESIPYPGESKKQHMIRLSQAKAIGVLSGVWDLVFYYRGVLYIFDVKVGPDKLSDKQIRFRDYVVSNGGQAFEIRTLEEFTEHVNQIFNA